MRSYLAIAIVALLTAACGANNPLTDTGPSNVSPNITWGEGAGKLAANSYTPGVNSCPDGELVAGINVNVTRSGVAIVQWAPVGSIHEYTIRVVRYQTGEQVLYTSVRDREIVKIGPLSDSTYRVYVSYQNNCGGSGPAGEGVVFSIDSPDVPAPIVIIGGGDDGETGPVIDPPNNPGGGNEGDGGNNGNNGGGNGTGNEGNGNGPGDNPPPPPVDPDVTICHHAKNGTSQTLTLPLSAAHNGHLTKTNTDGHKFDHIGACD